MSAYTPAPWPAPNLAVFEIDRQPSDLPAGTLSLVDYERARACVDACDGVANGDLHAGGVAVAQRELIRRGELMAKAADDIDALRAQRDELAAALQSAYDSLVTRQRNEADYELLQKISAALAKVQP